METKTYKITYTESMLFDLCVNKTINLTDSSLTDEDKEWFHARIGEAQALIRNQIAHILPATNSCSDPLCFELVKAYDLHPILLPAIIENTIVAIICDQWLQDKNVESNLKAKALEELKSFALRQDSSYSRKCSY